MTWIEHHRLSEQCASQAEACLREGRAEEARGHYARSAEAEERALGELDLSKTKTYGITAVSAASLYYKARRLADAERIAIASMGFDRLPPFARQQLRDIVQVVWVENVRQIADPPFASGEENSRQSASYCGTLRAVHLDKDWLVVDVRGQRVRIHGVREQVDAIGRLINKLVTVHVATKGGKHRFVRIERAD